MTKYIILGIVLLAMGTVAVTQYILPDSKISRVMRKKLSKPLEASKSYVTELGQSL